MRVVHGALAALIVTAVVVVGGCLPAQAQAPLPGFIVPGSVRLTTYDGVTDDLATGGLGVSGLMAPRPPAVADPDAPTAAELRRRAIYDNYRALVDVSPGGGFGVLYGPNLDAAGHDTGTPGLIAGREYLALAEDGSGRNPVTLMVQIPSRFDPAAPCITTAPSSGSRGIYGAIGIGDWGLRHQCAVAYTDKGTGNGYDDLTPDIADDITGVPAPAARLAGLAQFTVDRRDGTVDAYVRAEPHRIAYKHAHSRTNPERYWGADVLHAIVFALWAVNDSYPGHDITAAKTITIAVGVSNGGGAVLRAGERDTGDLIKGIVAGEPQIQPAADGRITIDDPGDGGVYTGPIRPLFDTVTLMNLYAPCAALAPALSGTPMHDREPLASPAVGFPARANRCASLADWGLLTPASTADEATQALAVIDGAGMLPEANQVLAAYDHIDLWRSVAQTYANAYDRASVADDLCGLSFAGIDAAGRVAALKPAVRADLFAAGSGIPPSAGVYAISEWAINGPIEQELAISASTGRADLNIDSALCLRVLATGQSVGNWQRSMGEANDAARIKESIGEVLATGNQSGRPVILVHGRSDGLVPPNFSSRAYVALNSIVEGAASQVRYLEVTHANHFDSLISGILADPSGNAQFVPLHYYVLQALDRMFAHLKSGAPLPPSQVIHATPRGATAWTAANYRADLPDIATMPAADSAIMVSKGTITIPP